MIRFVSIKNALKKLLFLIRNIEHFFKESNRYVSYFSKAMGSKVQQIPLDSIYFKSSTKTKRS